MQHRQGLPDRREEQVEQLRSHGLHYHRREVRDTCLHAIREMHYLQLSTSHTVLHICSTPHITPHFILTCSLPLSLLPASINNCRFLSRDSCTIQNTVLSAGCVVENNCNINECNVGCGAKIAAGSKIKSESISSAT